MDSNPLKKFFRQPAIYIRLPSRGQGWAPGSINMPVNGEIPVYPMTAIDEIAYRTPDALFNGEAVISVIQSCVPNILDAWQIPSTDIDYILVAIRIASYGHEMDIDTKCPKCSEESAFGLDLRTVIDNLRSADYNKSLIQNELTFHFRALNYREMTANSQAQFEQQKTLQLMGQQDMPEEAKVEQLNAMMKKLVDVTMHAIAQSVVEIRTTGTIVTDLVQIEEYLKNTDRATFNRIRDHVLKLREDSELRPLQITCPSCQHQYDQAFTMDMASFFASDS